MAAGQQLASAQQWLMDRMHAVAMPVPQGVLYRTLHDWISTPPRMFWRGGVARSNGANQLTAVVGYQSFNTPSERMRLLINGSENPKEKLKRYKVFQDDASGPQMMNLPLRMRDSSGNVHVAINTSALGPGSYQFSLEGLNWRGEATPQAWITVGVAH